MRNAATRGATDGVTTLFSPVGGRTRASLSFRVGTADEPLHLRGISHLIGHLAAAAADHDHAGCPVSVSASTLTFQLSGNALAVANEIGAICHWISTAASTPVDAKSIDRARSLAVDDQRIHAPEHAPLLRHRYGPLTWAAGSYPELGLLHITAAEITEWVSTYLTTQNAVLALSGTKATTLRAPLPSGAYQPLPELASPTITLPALVAIDEARVSLSGVIATDPQRLDRERAAAGLTAEIARSRIGYALGRRYGREITARGGLMALGRNAVHVVTWADVDSSREAKIADIATESLTVLGERKLVEGELAAQVTRRLAAYDRLAGTAAGAHELLHRQALGALNEVPWSLALERRLLSTTNEELVSKQISDLASSVMLAMRATDPPVRAWSAQRPSASFTPSGETFRSRPAYGIGARGSRPSRLIIGTDGITVRTIAQRDRQQKWSDIALAQTWDDGRHLLTAKDGSTFDLVPERWLAPDMVEAAIRDRLPDDVSTVPMGHRVTPSPAPLRMTDRLAPAWWWGAAIVGALLLLAAAVPVWSGAVSWLRWIVLAVGATIVVVAGAWSAETVLTERRLRASTEPHSDSQAEQQPTP